MAGTPMSVPFLACMLATATFYNLPPRVLPAIQAVEGGQVGSVQRNTDGTEDLGVMQINTRWIAILARVTGASPEAIRVRLVNDACFNIAASGAILRTYLNEAGGRPDAGRRLLPLPHARSPPGLPGAGHATGSGALWSLTMRNLLALVLLLPGAAHAGDMPICAREEVVRFVTSELNRRSPYAILLPFTIAERPGPVHDVVLCAVTVVQRDFDTVKYRTQSWAETQQYRVRWIDPGYEITMIDP